MKNIWVTIVIIITWVATTITIIMGRVDVFSAILLAFVATFYLIILGLQKPKE